MYRTFWDLWTKSCNTYVVFRKKENVKNFFIVCGKNDVDGLQEAGRDKDHYKILGTFFAKCWQIRQKLLLGTSDAKKSNEINFSVYKDGKKRSTWKLQDMLKVVFNEN